ncbi:DUF6300 family protein [Streptomyces jumonjinensis]|uniref:Uncharacterized protein n=1 Tax=Streptomyces jumonjinensis TaxID=1945 RepID=A0A646KKF4_STRJU|nr:DUF6300 family protein [Streptomyces jumonjinensis]MQT02762.1 hypothetical protein [Streptomyces jumonjinensis]
MDSYRIARENELPPCSRCGGEIIIGADGPVDGVPVRLELCPVCDTDAPAGGRLIAFLDAGGGRDASRVEEATRLMWAWQREAMAAHGFHWVPGAGAAGAVTAPSHTGPRPRGHG